MRDWWCGGGGRGWWALQRCWKWHCSESGTVSSEPGRLVYKVFTHCASIGQTSPWVWTFSNNLMFLIQLSSIKCVKK